MGLQTIPNDEELAGGEMAPGIIAKGDDSGGTDGAFDELEIDVPERDARHGRELVLCDAVVQDRRLAFGCKGPYAVRPFIHPGLVCEDDGPAFSRTVFFSAGQRFSFHCRMAASSRFEARPPGRWQEKFSPLMSRHTPDSGYRLPLIFAMSLPAHARVHRPVA
jgi:hypothetical protein